MKQVNCHFIAYKSLKYMLKSDLEFEHYTIESVLILGCSGKFNLIHKFNSYWSLFPISLR
eukprot:snap_masked-scaffold_3-processed-gene-20.7-mRNA-1 protein AED:1.00 eAED:1.00 QI:0/0/0/0/1/1/2/0/59